MKKETENWLKIANNDLKSAKALLKEGLNLNAIEHSHAALEKLIKGIITEQQGVQPPKIHALLKLVSLTVIQNVEDDIKKFLRELDASYISVRYPDDIERISLRFTKIETEEVVRKVGDIFKWLERQIK